MLVARGQAAANVWGTHVHNFFLEAESSRKGNTRAAARAAQVWRESKRAEWTGYDPRFTTAINMIKDGVFGDKEYFQVQPLLRFCEVSQSCSDAACKLSTEDLVLCLCSRSGRELAWHAVMHTCVCVVAHTCTCCAALAACHKGKTASLFVM